MKKVVLSLSSVTIIQVEAGSVDAIRDGGDLYIKVQSEEGGEDAPEPAPKKVTKAVEVEEEEETKSEPVKSTRGAKSAPAKEEAKSGSTPANFTEAEMMKMSVDDLYEILDELGIDPAKYEGKNTNRKLRLLVLDGYATAGDDAGEEEQEEEVAEVADDTKPARGARPARGAKAEKEESDGPEEIARADWETLEAGTLVLVKLFTEGDEVASDVLWEAEITGWDTPKGVKGERLFVLFQSDGEEDYLREEDSLYVFKKQL